MPVFLETQQLIWHKLQLQLAANRRRGNQRPGLAFHLKFQLHIVARLLSTSTVHPPAFPTLAVSRPPPITCHNLPKHVPGLELELDVCCPETPNRVRVPFRIRRKTSTGQSTDSRPLAIRGVGAQVEGNSSSPRHYAFRPSSTIPPVQPVQPQHSYEVPSKKTLALVLQACRRTTRPDQPPLPLRPTRIDGRPAITLQSLLKTTAHL